MTPIKLTLVCLELVLPTTEFVVPKNASNSQQILSVFQIYQTGRISPIFLLPVLQVAHWSVNQRSFPTDTPAVPLFLFRRRSNARSMFYVAARKWSLRPIDQGQLFLRAPIYLS